MYNNNKNTFTLFRQLSIAILHSVDEKDNKYYPRAYMEEYRYKRAE